MKRYLIAILCAGFLFASCDDDQKRPYVPAPPVIPVSEYAKGADISWITQFESQNRKFYDASGNQMEGTALMKSLGMDAIRLRVWVNPSGGWCNKQDVLVKALRAKNLGMRVMVDFHYSDTWADPGKQTKPAAWASLDLEGLKTAVANHTIEVLDLLKTNGVTVEWVQVGNETSGGMLWDTGKATTNMANYAQLNNAGYDAVKSVFPDAKVIVHINNGYDNGSFKWIFGGLKTNGGKWDIIGMSLYPHYRTPATAWKTTNDDCIANINDLYLTYGTPVILCEVGYPWNEADVAKEFLSDLLMRTRALPNHRCQGIFYWEPISNPAWSSYTLGAFDGAGKPTQAMDAFAL